MPRYGISGDKFAALWRAFVDAWASLNEKRDAAAKQIDQAIADGDRERAKTLGAWRYSAKIRIKTAEASLALLHQLFAPDSPLLCGRGCAHAESGISAAQAKRFLDSLDVAMADLAHDIERTEPTHQRHPDMTAELQIYRATRDAFWCTLSLDQGEAAARGESSLRLRRKSVLDGDTWNLIGAQLTADGKWVVSGSTSKTVFFIPTDGSGAVETLEKRGMVARLSPNGRFLVTATDEYIHLSDETGANVRFCEGHQNAVLTFAFVPDSSAFIAAGRGELLLHETVRPHTIAFATSDLIDAVVVLDQDRFLTGGDQGVIREWSVSAKRCVRQWDAHEARIRSLALASDRTQVLSAAADGTLRVWALGAEGQRDLCGYSGLGKLWSATFTADGRGALCVADFGTLWLIDLRDGSRTKATFGPEQARPLTLSPSITLLPGENRAMTTDADGMFIEWEYAL